MAVTARLRAEVARRARYHCEYCGYPEAASSTPLEVDHIIPEARGGPTTFTNLALCCRRCNLHKHVQTEAVDPDTAGTVPLFNRDVVINHAARSKALTPTPTGCCRWC